MVGKSTRRGEITIPSLENASMGIPAEKTPRQITLLSKCKYLSFNQLELVGKWIQTEDYVSIRKLPLACLCVP